MQRFPFAPSSLLPIALTEEQSLGFFNPRSNGGAWSNTWNNDRVTGEPLNVVISSLSDPAVPTYDGLLDYCSSLRFSPQCFQWYEERSQQAANLGDGNGPLNQTTIFRYKYDDPVLGTCSQTLQGGNHFRVFQQNGTNNGQANSGAWFRAAPKTQYLAKSHMIILNGHDLGRDEIVSLASRANAVQGEVYLGKPSATVFNHGISSDGRIAVLTVRIVEVGNGRRLSSNWFFAIRLPELLILVGLIIVLVPALGVFICVRYYHSRKLQQLGARAPPASDSTRQAYPGKEEHPLLNRSV
ncbi:uncharacterized protein JCM15063_001157 [Sporobolomyces koalae]|uniref:uncharacterized protein n=1 Tax=Sporobolomyces koalae TaxID=500713 RepID=UPI003172A565